MNDFKYGDFNILVPLSYLG